MLLRAHQGFLVPSATPVDTAPSITATVSALVNARQGTSAPSAQAVRVKRRSQGGPLLCHEQHGEVLSPIYLAPLCSHDHVE
jgi:hypothetical protein